MLLFAAVGSGDLSHRQQLLTPELEELRSNYDHQEAIMRRISDETTQEHSVAHMAFARLRQLISELELDDAHLELARQVGGHDMPSCQAYWSGAHVDPCLWD